jgi:hypothetical protein
MSRSAFSSLLVVIAFLLLTIATPPPAFAVTGTLTIDARANIFGAGHSIPPAPDGGGGGLLPSLLTFSPGSNLLLTFSSVTGLVSCCFQPGSPYNGPDGGGDASGTTDITSYGGISGIVRGDRTMFLVGIFLDASEPIDPAPGRLDFTSGDGFTDLYPELAQTFFVGDGLTGTGSGTVQRFHVPTGATRFYLGFADSNLFGNPTGPPGQYDNNTGSLTATLTVIPEPASLMLLASGLGWFNLGFGTGYRGRARRP